MILTRQHIRLLQEHVYTIMVMMAGLIQYPVAEIAGADYTTASSYITQSVLDNPATTDAQMRTQLNNVRTGLAATKALVTTYTYKPLIGMSSQTDAAGRSSYYEYDGFGRLNLVRDQYQNIVKKNCYNYLGQSTSCGTDVYPQWQVTGNTRFKPCQQNPTYNSPVQQQEEKDINPASPTYNQTIWVDYAIQFNPLESEWVNTSTPVRCRQISGQNTGEVEQEQVYSNPCGDIYGWTRWVVVGTNTSTCPLPPYFTCDDESGYYYSQTCASGANPDPIFVSVPAGHSTSTISVADANQQAILYAQNYANQHGTCTVPTFPLYFNNSATDGYDVYLYTPGTTDNPLYTFYIPASTSQAIGNILPGTYDIHIVGRVGLNSAYFDVGCSSTGYGTDQWFTNVSMANNSCNTIAASN
ncbi:hypothetical protein F5148DRAFT_1292489 [Russula earlei]|uniref:Uncharacterized protein n=1 Tax=Russula earlei TaxID=71964 RepID=A0ACC0TT50_9AGAM|nr:hypothetical protein F5148DRAFT_1292489 [Russula earlei]